METGLYYAGLAAGFGLCFVAVVPFAIFYAGWYLFKRIVQP